MHMLQNTGQTRRILIIDDDADVLDVMQEALKYEGFDVKIAERADDIFALIKEYDPQLIMMDYILKGINGGELCHQIKTNPETSNLPVVLLSAYPRVYNSLGTYGADEFIAKPFDLYDLFGRVNGLLMPATN